MEDRRGVSGRAGDGRHGELAHALSRSDFPEHRGDPCPPDGAERVAVSFIHAQSRAHM